jgi:hypothetical protein
MCTVSASQIQGFLCIDRVHEIWLDLLILKLIETENRSSGWSIS